MSWDLHIYKVCSKLSQKVGLFGRLRSSVPNEMLEIVYQTCVQPKIGYCITVWGYAPATLKPKVQSFQNRAARIITGIRDWNIRSLTLAKQLGWMNVMERRDYVMGMLMLRCVYGNAPNYLKDLLYLVSDIHSVPTRSKTNGDFYVPHRHLEIYKQSFLNNGPMTWNKLHLELKSIQYLSCFKRHLKAFIKANGHV